MARTPKTFTLANVRRIVHAVSIPGAREYSVDWHCGAYCLVEWFDSSKTSIRVRNMNHPAVHAEPIAAALRAAGLQVEIARSQYPNSTNHITLKVTEV